MAWSPLRANRDFDLRVVALRRWYGPTVRLNTDLHEMDVIMWRLQHARCRPRCFMPRIVQF